MCSACAYLLLDEDGMPLIVHSADHSPLNSEMTHPFEVLIGKIVVPLDRQRGRRWVREDRLGSRQRKHAFQRERDSPHLAVPAEKNPAEFIFRVGKLGSRGVC